MGERTQAPVIYLRELPDQDALSPGGYPYLVCPACDDGALVSLRDPAGRGVMLVCLRGCGQRFWVDLAEPRDESA